MVRAPLGCPLAASQQARPQPLSLFSFLRASLLPFPSRFPPSSIDPPAPLPLSTLVARSLWPHTALLVVRSRIRRLCGVTTPPPPLPGLALPPLPPPLVLRGELHTQRQPAKWWCSRALARRVPRAPLLCAMRYGRPRAPTLRSPPTGRTKGPSPTPPPVSLGQQPVRVSLRLSVARCPRSLTSWERRVWRARGEKG